MSFSSTGHDGQSPGDKMKHWMERLSLLSAALLVGAPAFAQPEDDDFGEEEEMEEGEEFEDELEEELELALDECEFLYEDCLDMGEDFMVCEEVAIECVVDVVLAAGATEEDLLFCEDIYFACADGELDEEWVEDFEDEDWDEEFEGDEEDEEFDEEDDGEEGEDDDAEGEDDDAEGEDDDAEGEDDDLEDEDYEDCFDGEECDDMDWEEDYFCEDILLDCLVDSALGETWEDYEDYEGEEYLGDEDFTGDEEMGGEGFSADGSELNTGDVAVDSVNVACSAAGSSGAGMLGFWLLGLVGLRRRR